MYFCFRNSVDTDDSPPHVSVIRTKRSIKDEPKNNTQSSLNSVTLQDKPSSNEREQSINHPIGKRSPSRHVRGMEMGSSGFHEDTFNSAFGDFITMRRRRIARTAVQKEKLDELLNKLSSNSDKSHAGGNMLSQDVFNTLKHPEYLIPKLSDKSKEIDLPLLLQSLSNLLRHSSKAGYFNERSLRKRRPEMDSAGFHGDTFGGSFGDFDTMKKRTKGLKMGNKYSNMYAEPYTANWLNKRRPEMDSAGFHGDTFGSSFGEFDTMKKRRPEMDSSGFHGDVFGGSFGEFDTMKKRRPEMDSAGFHGDTFGGSFGDFDTMKKRRPEMDSAGFHGDMFGGSFGDFDTMKKRRPEMDSAGFHGDTFGGSFGDFDTMKKRRPEMDSMGFHGDTFGGSFGDFDTMKKRRPEMDSMGFHGDTFGGSFGDFDTMKKRRPEMDSMGFHGDTFGGSFGDFDTMKKRRPEMDSMGFHGDTFGGSFGEFDTMKKRRPEMDSMGFHGDTFGGSFGDFDTMKKRSSSAPPKAPTDISKRNTNSLPSSPSQECNCDSTSKTNSKDDDKKQRFESTCLPNCPKKV